MDTQREIFNDFFFLKQVFFFSKNRLSFYFVMLITSCWNWLLSLLLTLFVRFRHGRSKQCKQGRLRQLSNDFPKRRIASHVLSKARSSHAKRNLLQFDDVVTLGVNEKASRRLVCDVDFCFLSELAVEAEGIVTLPNNRDILSVDVFCLLDGAAVQGSDEPLPSATTKAEFFAGEIGKNGRVGALVEGLVEANGARCENESVSFDARSGDSRAVVRSTARSSSARNLVVPEVAAFGEEAEVSGQGDDAATGEGDGWKAFLTAEDEGQTAVQRSGKRLEIGIFDDAIVQGRQGAEIHCVQHVVVRVEAGSDDGE